MPSVLFVCTGNRYRSPIAAAAFLKRLRDEGNVNGWVVGSAGTWTMPGLPPLPAAIQAAHQYGLNIDAHITRLVSAVELSQYDLILVMETGHKEAIESEFPFVRNRVFLLSEVVDGIPYNILDPLVNDESISQELVNELCGLIQRGYQMICQLAKDKLRFNLE
jgi:protein-tyrosine-phosphatase